MRVLVTAASKHGATAEIAEAIGATLRRRGVEAAVLAPTDVVTLDGYDAAVVGSAVYMGRWLDAARQLVEENQGALLARPVWLFSSGPVGDPPKPTEEPVDVADLVAATGARGHTVFAGRLDRHKLGLGEKAVVLALRAPEGDFRDWAAVEAFAVDVATALGGTS